MASEGGLQSEVSPLKSFNESPGTEGTEVMSGTQSQGGPASSCCCRGRGAMPCPRRPSHACLEASTEGWSLRTTSPTERSWPPSQTLTAPVTHSFAPHAHPPTLGASPPLRHDTYCAPNPHIQVCASTRSTNHRYATAIAVSCVPAA